MTTRSGSSSRRSFSTCSSTIVTSASSGRYAARVARPSGGNSEYLIGRKNGLVASVRAGRIILTLITSRNGPRGDTVTRRSHPISLLAGARPGAVDQADARGRLALVRDVEDERFSVRGGWRSRAAVRPARGL